MDHFTLYILAGVFGLVLGSFLNVVALRYDGEHFLLNTKVIGGRSRCPHCKHTLSWYELIPLISFVIQGGKCRNCKAHISAVYPAAEAISAAVFVFVPLWLSSYPWLSNVGWYTFSLLWIAAFEILLLITYIDIRLQIVPDELTILLGVVAVLETIFAASYLGPERQSFLGPFAAMFGFYGNVWLNHIIGAIFGGGFFGLLVLITRGKGMGLGDVKLGLPLGFLFGWPDIAGVYMFSFIVGAITGIVYIVQKRGTVKSALPFVPFLTAGALFIFFLGFPTILLYFRIIGV